MQYRLLTGPLGSSYDHGNNGAFGNIPYRAVGGKVLLNCVVSDGRDWPESSPAWEHVSVSIASPGRQALPDWYMMCFVKDLWWTPEEWVVQFHPAESKYVNIHEGVLHLWRPCDGKFPQPPQWSV